MKNKPNFKKREKCGAYGMTNPNCKYFSADLLEEVRCSYYDKHPNANKKEGK